MRLLLEEDLKGIEMEACLRTFFYLVQKNYIKEFDENVLDKILSIVKMSEPQAEHVENALAVLCQILYLRGKGHDFDNVKSYVSIAIIFVQFKKNLIIADHF